MVKWSLPAKIDLKHIHAYIYQYSQYYTEKVKEKILE